MKKFTTGHLVSFGFGSAFGAVIFDYFVHDSIDWFRAIFIGIFVTISLLGFNWVFYKSKSKATNTDIKN